MGANEIKQEIDRLGLSEKLLLLEDVWDSIAASNETLPLPEWQKQELEQRFAAYRSGNQSLHDSASVHEELRQSYIISDERLNHQPEVTSGVLANECGALLKKFFRNRRK